MKIAIVGAGSIGFTRRLVRDILSVPELQDAEFAFQDISAANLDMVATLCRRDIDANGVPAAVTTGTEREPALEGADFVINTARVGGLEGFRTDVEVPLKYGVDQCVGDTICAGGLMYGQRTVPMILELVDQIERYAGADRVLLNYANPMAMNTWAALDHSPVKTIGLCHGVQGGHHLLARLFERHVNDGRTEDDPGFRRVTKADVDIVAAGINHQTWYFKVLFDGRDWANDLLGLFEADPVIREREKVRIDIIRRFGYFSTESKWPPVRVPALVPQAPGRDPRLDFHRRLDPRRDRRVSPRLHREPQLVRDRLPQVARRDRRGTTRLRSAATNTARTSSSR